MKTEFLLSPPAAYAPQFQTAISPEARYLQQHWEVFLGNISRSIAVGSQYHRLLAALATCATDAARDNWDGHDAAPVSARSLVYAKRIARMLPMTVPPPEVSVDPDGEVALDWRSGPRRTLSMSIDPTGTLRYASIIGGSENFGLEPWRDAIPESILRILQKVAFHDATV